MAPPALTMPISVLIADDEASGRHTLRRLLSAERDVDLVAQCANGTEALAQIVALQPDVALLDIEMPGKSGLDLAEAVRELPSPPVVVFVTAYDRYAGRAFRVEAFDYLLKPVEKAELQRVLDRIRNHLDERTSAQLGRRFSRMMEEMGRGDGDETPASAAPGPRAAPRRSYLERIAVRQNERIFFVRVADVDWFQATGNYVRLHAQKRTFEIRATLGSLEAQLDPAQFARIHRQTIVNLDRVRELHPWSTGDFIVKLVDGTELRLSRTYRAMLDDSMYNRKSS